MRQPAITAREVVLAYMDAAQMVRVPMSRRRGRVVKAYVRRDPRTRKPEIKKQKAFSIAWNQGQTFGIFPAKLKDMISTESEQWTDWDLGQRTGAGWIDPQGKVYQVRGMTHLDSMNKFMRRGEDHVQVARRLGLIRFRYDKDGLVFTFITNEADIKPKQKDTLYELRQLTSRVHNVEWSFDNSDTWYNDKPKHGYGWNDLSRRLGLP